FYGRTLTPAAYHAWLRVNAVGLVALSTSVPDSAGVAEAATVRAGQPWLVPIWHDDDWRLYRVVDAVPLADPPATVLAATPATITLRMAGAGTAVVRVRWSGLLRAPGATLAPAGPWTRITVTAP